MANCVWGAPKPRNAPYGTEFVSIARYAMFSQGYWHHTVRAMKAMLARAVRSLVAEANDKVREIIVERFLAFGPDGALWAEYPDMEVVDVRQNGHPINGRPAIINKVGLWY